MIIFPAIDIKEGKVVRLIQGKFNEVTEYSQSPVTIAQEWEKKGAQWLHVVDLDGAQTGEVKNLDLILEIAKTVKIPIQAGGGIRSEEIIERLLKNGVSRVVLGTKAIDDRKFLKKVLSLWQNKIAVSLDCARGYLTERGWTETTQIKAADFAQELEKLGITYLIYTDISRDGMLKGPHFEGLQELIKKTKIPVIASGGVTTLDDIRRLASMGKGISGAIIGKALYEGKLDLSEAIKLCTEI